MLTGDQIAILHKVQKAALKAVRENEESMGNGHCDSFEHYKYMLGRIEAYKDLDENIQQMIRRDKEKEFQDDGNETSE